MDSSTNPETQAREKIEKEKLEAQIEAYADLIDEALSDPEPDPEPELAEV